MGKKEIIFTVIGIFGLLVLLELTSWGLCSFNLLKCLNKEKINFPFVNFDKKLTDQEVVLSNYNRLYRNHYFTFDPILGIRFKPNLKMVGVEPDDNGFPQIADKMSLLTDKYGYIASDSTNTRDVQELVESKETFLIVVSGGATTHWGASNNESTWPSVLEKMINANMFKKLKKKGYKKVAIVNTGVFGYGVANELKRFISETFYLHPDLVISLSGINEIKVNEKNPVAYEYNRYHYQIVKTMNKNSIINFKILPYFLNAIQYITFHMNEMNNSHENLYGFLNLNKVKSSKLYVDKLNHFSGICKASGIDFVHFLQPTQGSDGKIFTAHEKKILNFFNTPFLRMSWENFKRKLTVFYYRVRKNLYGTNDKSFSYDLSKMFEKESRTIYHNPRHYNDLGHKLLAEKIYDILSKKYE